MSASGNMTIKHTNKALGVVCWGAGGCQGRLPRGSFAQ